MERKQTALITFMRHGQKDAKGQLTDEGNVQAKEQGIHTRGLDGDILLFHSGVGRVKDTILTMAKYLHMNEKKEEIYASGRSIVDYVAPNLHFLINHDSRGIYHSEWNANEGSDDYMKKFLELDWRSPEPNVWYSPRQMAQNIAQMIVIETMFANMTETKHVVNIVNGSHEPVLTAFLCYFFQDYHFRSAQFVDDFGGGVNFAEGFTIALYNRTAKDFDVELTFRGVTKALDIPKTRRFAFSEKSVVN